MSASHTPGGPPPLASFTVGEGTRGVVLMHGFLGSGKNVRSLAQRWIAQRPDQRILVPDLPGHGNSPPLPPGADLARLADEVLATAASVALAAPVALVGHSLGGRVALAAAAVAPARVSELILLDIAPGPIDPGRTGTAEVLEVLLAAPAETPDRRTMRDFLLGRGLGPALADWLLMNLEPVAGGSYRWRIDRPALAAFHDRFNRSDLWPVVEARRLPIRCIRGGRSRQVSDADAARFQAAGCPVDTIPEASHYLHVDALDALVRLLLEAASFVGSGEGAPDLSTSYKRELGKSLRRKLK
jgi:esterase